jgi:hypothetical protein
VLRQNFEGLEFQIPFKCILEGLMNMIDGMRFWTPIFFHMHNTVFVSPWLCCIDKWHAESLLGCPGLNIFKWVVAGGIFLKDEDEVEQQQLVYFKNKVFTITDTGWRPPQCMDIGPKKMMVWQKELIVHALQCMKFMHIFFLIFYRVYAVSIQDHYIITEGIVTIFGWNVLSKFMTKCCSYYGVNESVHFNNVWDMSVQISLEANDLSTY